MMISAPIDLATSTGVVVDHAAANQIILSFRTGVNTPRNSHTGPHSCGKYSIVEHNLFAIYDILWNAGKGMEVG